MCGIRPWEFDNLTPYETYLIISGRKALDHQLALLLSGFHNVYKKERTKTYHWEDFSLFESRKKKKPQSVESLKEKLKVLTLRMKGKIVHKEGGKSGISDR